MTLDPIIEDAKIPEIIHRKYFSLKEQFFWLLARQISTDKIDDESYRVHVNADNYLPETRYDFIRTLPDYLEKDIDGKFEKLKVELNRYLVTLNDDASKKAFLQLILNQLQIIEKQIENVEAPGKYLKIIKSRSSENIRDIKNNIPAVNGWVEEKKKKTWNVKYLRNWDEDDGRFEDFFNRLKFEGLIETNLTNFKHFFSDKEPGTKIKWLGKKAQLVTFISTLKKKDCIKIYRQWSAFSQCFEAEFRMNKLSSDTPLTDQKEIDKMQDICKELDF